MNNKTNPLGKEHLQLVDKTLRDLHDLQDLIGKCKNCGIPVDEIESDRLYLVDQLTRIKQEFFPHAG